MYFTSTDNRGMLGFVRRLGGVFLVLVLVVMGIVSDTNVARADPHAIFYTAIGQQQLFFNVLAALDQADYVETSLAREQKRGAREQEAAEPQFVRESLSGARLTVATELKQDRAGQSASDPSQPGEPALVNRQVTLEGADLYTDQLVRQFGAESARRNAAAELLQALCENGFGIEGCDNDASSTNLTNLEKVMMEVQRKEAMVVDPLSWAGLPYLNGAWAALNSGNQVRNIDNPHPDNVDPLGGPATPTLSDEEYRAGKKLMPEVFGSAPMAYSAEIAAWRDFVRRQTLSFGSDNEMGHRRMLEGALKGVDDLFAPTKPARYPYQEYILDANGNLLGFVGLTDDPSICGNVRTCLNPNAPSWSARWDTPQMTVASYDKIVSDMVATGSRRIGEIASNAATRIEQQQKVMMSDGVLAKTSLKEHPAAILYPNPISLSSYGELSVNIDTPVAAREASIYAIPNVLGMLATSQEASSLEGLDIPGSVQLVKRAGGSGSQLPQCNNNVDDEGDGYIDYPQDPECVSYADTSESLPGLQSSVGNSGPQVAGALDLLFDSSATSTSGNFFNFDEEKRETSPSANIISPILEFGARHALRVLTAGDWRESTTAGVTCGFTCD